MLEVTNDEHSQAAEDSFAVSNILQGSIKGFDAPFMGHGYLIPHNELGCPHDLAQATVLPDVAGGLWIGGQVEG